MQTRAAGPRTGLKPADQPGTRQDVVMAAPLGAGMPRLQAKYLDRSSPGSAASSRLENVICRCPAWSGRRPAWAWATPRAIPGDRRRRPRPGHDHRPEAPRSPGPEVDRAVQAARGMPIGAHSTLRGDRMWEFLDRLISVAAAHPGLPRAVVPKQFDGHGSYTFGLTRQVVFPGIDRTVSTAPRHGCHHRDHRGRRRPGPGAAAQARLPLQEK